MHKFKIYVELDARLKFSKATKQRLVEYSDLLSECFLTFCWIYPNKKITAKSIFKLVRFERDCCTYKRNIVSNVIVSPLCETSLLSKYAIKKYKFKFEKPHSEAIVHDIKRMSYNNPPKSCTFNSCLGNCVYINALGEPGICPFVENQITLNSQKPLESIYDIFDSESFIALLQKSIQKRKQCKGTCRFFSLCKGSCPLTEEATEICCTKSDLERLATSPESCTNLDPDYYEQTIEHLANMYKV